MWQMGTDLIPWPDSCYATSSSKGHDMIVEIPLAYDTAVKVPGRCYKSDAVALQTSTWEGHDKIVEMLLTKGANANV